MPKKNAVSNFNCSEHFDGLFSFVLSEMLRIDLFYKDHTFTKLYQERTLFSSHIKSFNRLRPLNVAVFLRSSSLSTI